MTFIYGQALGLQSEFNTILLTSNRATNIDRFPFTPLYEKEKTLSERFYRFVHKALGSYALLSENQLKYFEDILVKENIKVIHAQFGPSGIEILPLAKKLHIPLVTTFHGYDASELLSNKRYAHALAELFDYSFCIVVSEHMMNQLIPYGLRQDCSRVIYCGIPVNKFHYVERMPIFQKIKEGKAITLLQISALVEKKGHRYTLEAFSRLLSTHPNCTLVIAGDGMLRRELEAYCTELNIEKKVSFVGSVNSETAFKLMKDADIFVHHSVTQSNGDKEGIPTVLMEAMATGLPVISTFHSGIPELIRNSINGYLVPEKDIAAYTDAIIRSFSSPETLHRTARQTIEESFALEHQNRKLNQFIREISYE